MTLETAKQLYAEGRQEEAFNEFRSLLANNPTSADFFTSFGKLLVDVDQIETAEKIAGTATKMPDVTAESWLLCGKIYIKLKNFNVAKGSFMEGLLLDNENKDLHEELGLLLKNEFYDYQNAISHLEKAEQSARVISSMGLCYRGVFDDEKAEECFLKSIEKDKFFAPTYSYYLNLVIDKNDFNIFYKLYDRYFEENLANNHAMVLLNFGKALCLYLENKLDEASEAFNGGVFFPDNNWNSFELRSIHIMIAYRGYLAKLLRYTQETRGLYEGEEGGVIHVIGDSHSLSYAWLNINNKKVIPHLIMGCKIHHLIIEQENRYRNSFKSSMLELPDNSDVILSVGEIDCRDEEGFMPKLLNDDSLGYKSFIKSYVKKYIKLVKEIKKIKNLNIIISGVAAPNEIMFEEGTKEYELRLNIIKTLNKELEISAKNARLGFITTHNPQGNGLGNEDIFIDMVHIKPDIYYSLLSDKYIQTN